MIKHDMLIPMNRQEFNLYIAFALRNDNKKVSFCKVIDNNYFGGMTDTLEDALKKCKEFYDESPNCRLSIGDFSNGTEIWETESILHELGIISDEEYNKYLDNLDLEG